MTEAGRAARKPRADAARNRERVLEAANVVFNAGGPEASLEAVARQAGVGIGTLYRHFPTRQALFEAVYRREVQNLAELAEQLLADRSAALSPVEALRRWMRSNVAFIATKKGMSAALTQAALAPPELMANSVDRLTQALGGLMARAIEAGEIRADIEPLDLLRGLVGLCYAHDRPGWQENVLRMVDVLVDGLRREPEQPAPNHR
ncbi:TetR family transcriptional regulator [Humitalea rosea]|uniref:TetR family transcriptional regulator n=1 Tax=Humitalea rosea TaxID=990373 RepID=A0A2W7ILU5_9PROT|nr:TetR/AcrR family transcriptional regulator [Humitalea rosea]PZW46731.1 TetR family transcriptional regulator [Humitalea rosea]